MSDAYWRRAHATAVLCGLASLLALQRLSPLIAAAAISFLLYLLKNRRRLRRLAPCGGYANWLTLSRLLLLLYASTQYRHWHPYWSFAAFLLVIVSDGIDGYLARRLQQQSKIGEMLDVETDALMSGLLAAIHYLQGTAGWWLLVAGSLRYWYVWGIYWSSLEGVEAKSPPYTRLIGVVFISALMAPFVLPGWLAFAGLIAGSGLVAFSFVQSYRNHCSAKRASALQE